MQSVIFESPINSLSFGNVSLNLLKEFFRRRDSINLSLFPVGQKINLEAYDKLDLDFKEWIYESYHKRFSTISKDCKTLKLWHLNGSEMRVGSGSQTLYTFYEASHPTTEELSLCSLQDKVAFSSSYSKEKFSEAGASNCYYIPPGFDSDFGPTSKVYLPDKIHFCLMVLIFCH